MAPKFGMFDLCDHEYQIARMEEEKRKGRKKGGQMVKLFSNPRALPRGAPDHFTTRHSRRVHD